MVNAENCDTLLIVLIVCKKFAMPDEKLLFDAAVQLEIQSSNITVTINYVLNLTLPVCSSLIIFLL